MAYFYSNRSKSRIKKFKQWKWTNKNHIPGTKKGDKVILKPGDMLVYKGFDLEHWREPLKKVDAVNCFYIIWMLKNLMQKINTMVDTC